jgi:peptidoglycan/LPS O-acetylase OafA/YrhL
MEEQSFDQQRFLSLQVLRGIAAILVVTEHIRFINRGAFGVDVFFVISGFMMMLSTQKSRTHFWKKRLWRILPPYYLLTLGTFLLLRLFPGMFEQTQGKLIYLVKSLLFIPFDMGGGVLQPIYRIGWTVNCEMFFYLLFGIAMHISYRFRSLICTGFLLSLVILAGLLPIAWAPLIFYGDPVMLEFSLGIGLYYVLKWLDKRITWKSISYFSLLGAMGILCLLFVTKERINILGFGRLIYWGIPAAFIVILFFLGGLFLKMPKPLVKLGDMSYSVYLVHYFPIMFLDRKVFDFSSLNRTSILGSILAMGIVLVLSWLFSRTVEQWSKHLARRA